MQLHDPKVGLVGALDRGAQKVLEVALRVAVLGEDEDASIVPRAIGLRRRDAGFLRARDTPRRTCRDRIEQTRTITA